mgnify:CR=1 FL=1
MNRIHLFTIISCVIVSIVIIFYAENSSLDDKIRSSNRLQSSQTILVDVGSPRVNKMTFSEGNSSLEFVATEEFPITIFSSKKTHVELKILNLPKGVWTKFIPQEFDLQPGNNSAKLLLVGAVEPFTPTSDNTTLTIFAKSSNDNITKRLPVIQTENITILNTSGPIEFSNGIIFNQNGSSFQTYGVVYDPTQNFVNTTLSVNLSVIGSLQDGKITTLPPWLKINIPEKTFSLVAEQPHYFVIAGTTSSAPVGNQIIMIKEIINGQQFTRDLQVTVPKPIRLHK